MTKTKHRLVEYVKGEPVFGSGPIKGWAISVAQDKGGRERTLRNAALAAFKAESMGEVAKALRIWDTPLEGGSVLQLFHEYLPKHVAQLAGKAPSKTQPERPKAAARAPVSEAREAVVEAKEEREAIQAADRLTPEQVQAMVNERTDSLGRPAMHRWGAKAERGMVLLYEWPGDEEWIAFEIDQATRTAERLRERPVRPEESKRLRQKAGERHDPKPTPMEEKLGAQLPPTEGEGIRLPERVVMSLKVDVPSALIEATNVIDSPNALRGKACKAKTYRACWLCHKPIELGEAWVAKNRNTSRRMHVPCFDGVAKPIFKKRANGGGA